MVRSRRSRKRTNQSQETQRDELVWHKVDLHIHTPASADYQQSKTQYIDILQRAEERDLSVIAFTDHNSVSGYARMWREIQDLELLEALDRIKEDESRLLAEYRRLLNKILVLPGFEFTATFGFHILALFPPETSIRKLEHLLLTLEVPEEKLDIGSSEVGATTDVLRCYEILNEAGALVIGAHVNSTHGIAMQGFPFGKQTKMDYTQNENLHALEATDLVSRSRRTTARFFSGTKAEYPRRMHSIQGSDAHRLTRDPERETNLGVGDRPTEMLLPEVSFHAIKALLQSQDFDRTRPAQPTTSAAAFISEARQAGDTQQQVFHERLATRRTKSNALLKDIAAIANTDGGTVFVGLNANSDDEISGISRPDNTITRITEDVAAYISPSVDVSVDQHEVDGKSILVVTISEGSEKPYTLGSGEIYIRRGANTVIASRDDIVEMVRASLLDSDDVQRKPETAAVSGQQSSNGREAPAAPGGDVPPPETGVEILNAEDREGETFYTVHDLRNDKVVPNVTRSSSRSLWRYAITQREDNPLQVDKVNWQGRFAVVGQRKQRYGFRYDLAYRENGTVRVFYGVTEKGLKEPWKELVEQLSGEPA